MQKNGQFLDVFVSAKRRLTFGDGTGRETWISLGIFAEACKLAAAGLGLGTQIDLVQGNPAYARLSFLEHAPSAADATLNAHMDTRYSDRSIFSDQTIASEVLAALGQVQAAEGCTVYVSAEQPLVQQVAQLTRQGISIALSSPDFRNELAEWVTRRGASRPIGIPAESLRLGAIREYIEPFLLKKGWGLKKEIAVEYARWHSAQAVLFVLTEGDTTAAWFNAGRTYLRAVLAATAAGLSHSTSASIVEASTFHEDIEQAIGTTKRLQCVIRLGYGRTKGYKPLTPRLKSSELTE